MIYIILPIFNEAKNLQRTIETLFQVSSPEDYQLRIVAVNDGSTDNSMEILNKMAGTMPIDIVSYAPNQGIPMVLRRGFKHLSGILQDDDIVVVMESDGTSDVTRIPIFIEEIKKGADIVIGSRNVPPGGYINFPWQRTIGSMVVNWFLTLVWRVPGATDYTIFFRAYRGSLLIKFISEGIIFQAKKSFAANGELLRLLARYEPRIVEVPLRYDYGLKKGKSKMKLFQTLFEYARISIRRERSRKDNILCPCCKNNSASHWFVKEGWVHYRCRACGLIFIHPAPQIPPDLYSRDYFCGAVGGRGYVNYEEEKSNDGYTFAAYLDEMEKNLPNKGRLLDVGAATGSFLGAAGKRGWRAEGIEISDYAAAEGRKKGLCIATGTVEQTCHSEGVFDAVTLWDVFEHVPYPERDLETIKRLLMPGGILFMNLPDSQSLFARITGTWWPLLLPPEHIHLFSERGLTWLLSEHGFETLQVRHFGKRFAPSYILQLLSTVRGQKIWKKLSEWIKRTPLDNIRIPLNLRHNMFVAAKKIR